MRLRICRARLVTPDRPGGTNTSVLLDLVDLLIAHGVRGSLYHHRTSGMRKPLATLWNASYGPDR